MKRILASMLAASLALLLVNSNAYAVRKDTVQDRKIRSEIAASCEREAKAKKFGVHLIKKRKFIKECVAQKNVS